MGLQVLPVDLCQVERIQDQKVFGVVFLGRLGEVKASCDDDVAIYHHHLVVSDGVGGIDPGGDPGVKQKRHAAVLSSSLAPVKDGPDINTTVMGSLQSSRDGCAGEAVCLNQNRRLGVTDGCNDCALGPAVGAEVDLGRNVLQKQVESPEGSLNSSLFRKVAFLCSGSLCYMAIQKQSPS